MTGTAGPADLANSWIEPAPAADAGYMHAAGPVDARRPQPGTERGAILVLVLMVTVGLGLLGLALAASTETAVRSLGNARALDRAERAAASGVEWAAAAALANGFVDADRAFTSDGAYVVVALRTAATPQVTSRAVCDGAAVTLRADLEAQPGAPLPFALASFATQSVFDQRVDVEGSAYFGETPRPIGSGSGTLHLAGDLYLVTTTTLASGLVAHSRGATRYGTARIDAPASSPDAVAGAGGVPVTRFVGSTEIRNRTISGLVVADLDLGQRLTIRDSVIEGTLVVRVLISGLLGLGLLPPDVCLAGTTTITGGTAATGNLAILGPGCDLSTSGSTGSVVAGVTLVRSGQGLAGVTFRGQLLTLRGTTSSAGPWRVERPAEFVPVVPLGVQWPGPATVRIRWCDRQ